MPKQSKCFIDCLPPVVEALNAQHQMTGKSQFIFLAQNGDRMTLDHFRNVVWAPALKKAGLDYRPPL